jgi:hypothetical protein
MSGWQRTGVVVSILWLLGRPVYLLMEVNRRADKLHDLCLIMTRDRPDTLVDCIGKANDTVRGDLAHALVAGTSETAFLWGVLLVPIILLWLVGGIVLGTGEAAMAAFARSWRR